MHTVVDRLDGLGRLPRRLEPERRRAVRDALEGLRLRAGVEHGRPLPALPNGRAEVHVQRGAGGARQGHLAAVGETDHPALALGRSRLGLAIGTNAEDGTQGGTVDHEPGDEDVAGVGLPHAQDALAALLGITDAGAAQHGLGQGAGAPVLLDLAALLARLLGLLGVALGRMRRNARGQGRATVRHPSGGGEDEQEGHQGGRGEAAEAADQGGGGAHHASPRRVDTRPRTPGAESSWPGDGARCGVEVNGKHAQRARTPRKMAQYWENLAYTFLRY